MGDEYARCCAAQSWARQGTWEDSIRSKELSTGLPLPRDATVSDPSTGDLFVARDTSNGSSSGLSSGLGILRRETDWRSKHLGPKMEKGKLLDQGVEARERMGAAATDADQPRLAVGAIACLVKVNETRSERKPAGHEETVGMSRIDKSCRYSGQPEA
jgi:hypothetical protein